jgi:hypothetical protein
MSIIKPLTAPIRRLVNFPLFQLMVVVALILYLQAADEKSLAGLAFTGLDKLVGATVQGAADLFTVRSFTRAWLVSGFMMAYVYLACLLIVALLRVLLQAAINFAGRHNVLGLRSAIARERGVTAYRAWVPLETLRPADIPQAQWEETYAWPADDRPPYPPVAQRLLLMAISNVAAIALVLILLQWLTPFPVLTWLRDAVTKLFG